MSEPLDAEDIAFLHATFTHCRFHVHLGFELVPIHRGKVEVIARYKPELDQAMGFIHGGVYAALLDSATYYSALSQYGRSGRLPLTSEYKINLLATAKQEDVRAVAEVLRAGRTVAVSEAKLYAGTSDKLVAAGMASFIVPSS